MTVRQTCEFEPTSRVPQAAAGTAASSARTPKASSAGASASVEPQRPSPAPGRARRSESPIAGTARLSTKTNLKSKRMVSEGLGDVGAKADRREEDYGRDRRARGQIERGARAEGLRRRRRIGRERADQIVRSSCRRPAHGLCSCKLQKAP